ncbi:flagellar filament capping protein FliD [bacterium]|nr:flagellar filament capping protein FliD [bacterium]
MALITFSGLASGIDSSALIEAMLEQERITRVNPFQRELTDREETNSSFDELKNLLGELSTSVQSFRTINGGAISKNAVSSDETVLTTTASSAANQGSYAINVSQLATNATFSFNDRFTATDEVIGAGIDDGASAADRTVSFTVGQGDASESVDIELTSTTTAAQFVSSFNDASGKATASLVNLGTESSPSYSILIQSNETGEEEGSITLDSVGSEVSGAGSFTANTLLQANNLEFTLDGISGTISRSSNTVNDVIPGISFTAGDTGSATISVNVDSGQTEGQIAEFVEKYNAVVSFIAEQDAISEEQVGEEILNVFGPLATTSLDEGVLTALRSALSQSGSSEEEVKILADLGISTERDGTLKFDSDVFQEALANDADGVESLLAVVGEGLGAVDGTIAQYTRFNGLIDEAVSGNNDRIAGLQDRIQSVEESLLKKEESLIAQFARLESQISQLQSQQNSLSSLLPA